MEDTEPFLPNTQNRTRNSYRKSLHSYEVYFALLVLLIVFVFIFSTSLSFRSSSTSLPKYARLMIVESNQFDEQVSSSLPCTEAPKNVHIPTNIHQLSKDEMFHNVELESNLAALYWYWWNGTQKDSELNLRYENVTYCDSVKLTPPYSVTHNNLHWQRFNAKPVNRTEEVLQMYLYNAYYDSRVLDQPVVKLLTMNAQELMGSTRDWFCLLWFDGIKAPVLVKISDYFNIWPPYWKDRNRYGAFHPQLISCPIPAEHIEDIPRAVSLQARGFCKEVEQIPSNVLRVIANIERDPSFKKPSFGVCVKAFRFGDFDMSVRLVEWLELLKLLGVDRVYLYVHGTNENVQKVLKQYKKQGFVDWRFLTLPGQEVNVNSLYNLLAYKLKYKYTASESLELNDCLNRNLYQHDYFSVVDYDEVIIPQGNLTTWQELVTEIEDGLSDKDFHTKGYYRHIQAHVCEMDEETNYVDNSSIPEHFYMLRHTYREKLKASSKDKAFHRTKFVTSVHNHLPTRCIGTSGYFKCPVYNVPANMSIMMHYRRNHVQFTGMTNNTPYKCAVNDRTIWRYYDEMHTNVQTQLEDIFKD